MYSSHKASMKVRVDWMHKISTQSCRKCRSENLLCGRNKGEKKKSSVQKRGTTFPYVETGCLVAGLLVTCPETVFARFVMICDLRPRLGDQKSNKEHPFHSNLTSTDAASYQPALINFSRVAHFVASASRDRSPRNWQQFRRC